MTAERIPTNRWETPANVTVITSQEIADNHYQTIAEALSHVNGVLINGIGRTDSSYAHMSTSDRVLLLVDGHRINSAQGIYSNAYGALSTLNAIPSVKMIEKIEVLKGGASALYGTDAVGGVINIITKKGTRNETEVDVNNGLWNRNNYEITNQGIKGKLSWFVTAGFGKSDDYKYHRYVRSNTWEYLYTDYEDRDISIRLDDKFSDRNSLTVSYMHRSHDFAKNLSYDSLFDESISVINCAGAVNLFYANDRYNLSNHASVEYKFKENTSTPGWIRYFNSYQKGLALEHDYFFSTSSLQGIEYQNGWEFGRHHKVVTGFEYHKRKADSRSTWLSWSNYVRNVQSTSYGYDDRLNNFASYLQDTIKVGHKLTLIPGVRLDHTSEFGNHWSPKFATNYRPDEKTKFYASWGRVYRTPTIGELYNAHFDYDPIWRGYLEYMGLKTTEYLYSYYSDFIPMQPESGHNEILGLEHDFNDDISVALSFFNTNLDNILNYRIHRIEEGYESFYLENSLKRKQRGIEITYKQNIDDHWKYDLGYSHTHIEQIDKRSQVTSLTLSNTAFYGQPNGYRIGLHYVNRGLKANLLGIMSSGLNSQIKTWANGSFKMFDYDKYAVFDFNASYKLSNNLEIYGRVLNLTNRSYSNNGNVSNAPGRFLQIGATYKF